MDGFWVSGLLFRASGSDLGFRGSAVLGALAEFIGHHSGFGRSSWVVKFFFRFQHESRHRLNKAFGLRSQTQAISVSTRGWVFDVQAQRHELIAFIFQAYPNPSRYLLFRALGAG